MEKVDKLISIEEFKTEQTPAQKFRKSTADLVELIKAITEAASITAEIHKQVAIEKKSKYDAFIAAGFDPKQALELCK